MKHLTISVTEFKAKCLGLLEDVGEHGGTITITKRGKPLATVGPVKRAKWRSPEGILAGKIMMPDGEPVNPLTELWERSRELEAGD